MTTMTVTKPQSIRNYLPALLADGVGIGLLLLLFAPLTAEFGRRTLRSGMIMLVIYVIFAFGVNALKRLERVPGPVADLLSRFDFTGTRWVMVLLALAMIVFFVVAQIDLNQATESMVELMTRPESYGHEGEITLYYSFGPVFLWLMIGVVYLAAFILPTEHQIAAGSGRYALVEFAGLLSINGMLIAATAYLAVVLGGMGLTGGGQLLAVLLALLLIELLFDPPRMRHALKNPGWWPLLSYTLLVLTAAGLLWVSF